MNKIMLIGNVGHDPEVHYYDADQCVASFSLATTERGYVLPNGTNVPDRTEWHNIVAWRGLAQVVEKYVKKGTQLYIEGKIRTRNYDDKDNIKRYITEIYVDNLQLLGRRGDNPQGETNVGLSVPASQQPASSTTSNAVGSYQPSENQPGANETSYNGGISYGTPDFVAGAGAAEEDDLPF